MPQGNEMLFASAKMEEARPYTIQS